MIGAIHPRPSSILAAWLTASLLSATPVAQSATNLSAWVFPGPSGRLLHRPDALGNRIPDFSTVGYRGGTVPIPEVPVKITIAPVAGDDGASIQAAINSVKALPLDANGFRGAVRLAAGEYDIAGSITVNASGIVLRGAGDSPSGTVLRAAGTGQRTLVNVTGSGSPSRGTARSITNNYVPVGARSFNVSNTNGLSAGSRVFVHRPSPTNWIHDLGMDQLAIPWTAGSKDLDSDRVITRVEGYRITLDAPLTCALEARYGGGTIQTYAWSGRISNVGIEDLRGLSDYTGPEDENHGWVFVRFGNVENAWARRVTSQFFGYACVQLDPGTKFATVMDAKCLDPVSIITGGRRYAFNLNDAQHCLVQNCYTSKDRHQFVTHSLTTGPNVFVDGLSDSAYSDAGPHHRWATGAIWDNVTVNGNSLNVQNRGNSGTGHGWAGANEVVWNSKANAFIVQNPPTARNWLIGSIGTVQNGTMYVGPHDPGTLDSHGVNVFPNSLYYAQLEDRLAALNLQTREYWVGDIDQFSAAEPVPVDPAWRSLVQTVAGATPVNGFDLTATNQWVPFTFNFSLSATDRLAGATLALGLRAGSAVQPDNTLYLDGLASSNGFAALGWLPLATGTNTTVCLLDLGAHLPLLADGKLNLALAGNVGIDWALLELQVTTAITLFTNALPPTADAFARAGLYTSVNYGLSPTLEVKADSSADARRQTHLRWDLASYPGSVVQAILRLHPASVGTNGLEHALAVDTHSSWGETSLTWASQPGSARRFATWIPSPDAPVDVVVTPQVQAALAGDRQLSFLLLSLKNVGSPGLVSYASREDPDPARRPQLLLISTNLVPAISNISSGSWRADASGSWSDTTRWLGGIPANGADMTASFDVDVTAPRFINNDAPKTLGHLAFGDANAGSPGSWVVTNYPISLQVTSGAPIITVAQGEATMAAALTGTQGLAKAGEGLLVLSASNSFSGPASLNAGPLRAADANALGQAPRATVGNAATARLELSGGISLSVPLTISCKGSALGDVPAVLNVSGTNTLTGPLTLTTGGSYWTFEAAGGKLLVAGRTTNSTTTNVRMIWLRGAAHGEWRSAIGNSAAALATTIRKDGPGTWTLAGTNDSTGNTTVSNGTLLVNGVIAGGTLTVAGGTLGGSGAINVPVVVQFGATLSPGEGLGTLSIAGPLTLSSGSITRVEINAQVLACDQIRGLTGIAYQGTLVVSNLAGALAPGQAYTLFHGPAGSGDFQEVLPASPGPGLAWHFDPANGTLSVLSSAPPRFLGFNSAPDGALSFVGTGPGGAACRVVATTNLALSLDQWFPIATGAFSNGEYVFTEREATNFSRRFYRLVTP